MGRRDLQRPLLAIKRTIEIIAAAELLEQEPSKCISKVSYTGGPCMKLLTGEVEGMPSLGYRVVVQDPHGMRALHIGLFMGPCSTRALPLATVIIFTSA